MTPPRTADAPVLPDLLEPGLRLVFCGTAAGHRSAAERAYYAHPGNRFWPALFEAGLTPRLFAPQEFALLRQHGIGLTDLAKHHSGNDRQLPRDAFDVPALLVRIRHCSPSVLAFTSKHAAATLLGKGVSYGWQPQSIGDTRLFVLPSPSGQARGHWSIAPWLALGEWLRSA